MKGRPRKYDWAAASFVVPYGHRDRNEVQHDVSSLCCYHARRYGRRYVTQLTSIGVLVTRVA